MITINTKGIWYDTTFELILLMMLIWVVYFIAVAAINSSPDMAISAAIGGGIGFFFILIFKIVRQKNAR